MASRVTFPRTHSTPQYVKARDIPSIPYLGGPEDRFAAVFGGYQSLVDTLRTPTFQEAFRTRLESDGVPGVIDLLNRYIADTNRRIADTLPRELMPVVNTGAAVARQMVVGDPLYKAGSVAALLPDDPLSRRRRGRADHRRPAPLPPFRRLLRVPASKYQPPRPDRHRTPDHTPTPYLNAVDLLTLSMVQNISDTQKDRIIDVVRQSVRKGEDIDIASMKVANMVALFPRWQRAVQNLQSRLEADGTMTPRAIQSRVNDYADWLRERRGIMIARTELMRAMNTGRLIAWHEQAEQGILDPKQSVKTWVSAPDACPYCLALNGTSIDGIDSRFETHYGDLVMPPCHPHCRCTVTIQPIGGTMTDEDWTPGSAGQDAASLNDPEMQALLGTMPG